jgi:hypothetical protein
MAFRLTQPPPPSPDTLPISNPLWQGWLFNLFKLFGAGNLGSFTVANLPNSPIVSQQAYATNGRKVGEAAGLGSGVPVYFSQGAWRVYSTGAVVAS